MKKIVGCILSCAIMPMTRTGNPEDWDDDNSTKKSLVRSNWTELHALIFADLDHASREAVYPRIAEIGPRLLPLGTIMKKRIALVNFSILNCHVNIRSCSSLIRRCVQSNGSKFKYILNEKAHMQDCRALLSVIISIVSPVRPKSTVPLSPSSSLLYRTLRFWTSSQSTKAMTINSVTSTSVILPLNDLNVFKYFVHWLSMDLRRYWRPNWPAWQNWMPQNAKTHATPCVHSLQNHRLHFNLIVTTRDMRNLSHLVRNTFFELAWSDKAQFTFQDEYGHDWIIGLFIEHQILWICQGLLQWLL